MIENHPNQLQKRYDAYMQQHAISVISWVSMKALASKDIKFDEQVSIQCLTSNIFESRHDSSSAVRFGTSTEISLRNSIAFSQRDMSENANSCSFSIGFPLPQVVLIEI